MRQLPSICSLRVVEALGQQGTVSAAAGQLNLTQSAVSKQLKQIETIAGTPLFLRRRQGLVPTAAGIIYINQARVVLGALETAAMRVAALNQVGPAPIRLHVLPILGDRWFIPRLNRFTERHPDIEVQFVTFAPNEIFREVDVVFRFGDGNWPGWRSDYFLGSEVILVGAPAYLAALGGIEAIDDVLRFRLLMHPQTPLSWDDFFREHGSSQTAAGRTTALGYYALVIRAALGGQGLALVPRVLILNELAAGELENPRGLGFASRVSYWLTTPVDRRREGRLALFCDWALAEARQSELSRAASPA